MDAQDFMKQQVAQVGGFRAGGPKLQLGTKGQVQEVKFKWPRDSYQLTDDDGELLFEFEKEPDGSPRKDQFGRVIPVLVDGAPKPLMSRQPDPSEQVEIWLKYVRLNRLMRQLAINETMAASMERKGRRGFDYQAFERCLVNKLIQESNIEGVPGPGWDELADPALGDYIVERLRVWEQVGGREAMALGKA